ncbi:hypothetical protein FZX15_03995 [Brucella suis bv. 1]|nr:hypothetical protein FZX15_03995 [Brucella suis bv. 1]
MQENFPRCDKVLSWRGMMRVIVEEVKKPKGSEPFCFRMKHFGCESRASYSQNRAPLLGGMF